MTGERGGRAVDPVVRVGRWVYGRLADALFALCYFGLWGVLRDVDHIPSYLYALFPTAYPAFAGIGGRFTHRLGFVSLCVVVGGLGAYVAGRVAWILIDLEE